MENQQDVFDAILGDDEVFLPDGWDGSTDIITETGELNDAAFASDGEQAAEEPQEENEDVAAEETEVPTTDEEVTEEPDQNADEEAAE